MSSEQIKILGDRIRAQYNRATDQPMFLVQQEVLDYGYKSAYSEEYDWYNNETCEPGTDEQAALLESMRRDYAEEVPEEWVKVYYKRRWEFVTACFTERGCEEYVKRNGHNLGKTRIYAESSYRNMEFRSVRQFLLSTEADGE
jgi:hypothetical protein